MSDSIGGFLGFVIGAIFSLFIIILFVFALGPALAQLNPTSAVIFYLGMAALFIAVIFGVIARVRRL